MLHTGYCQVSVDRTGARLFSADNRERAEHAKELIWIVGDVPFVPLCLRAFV